MSDSAFDAVVGPLHEASERQLVERARRQFCGSDEAFASLLQEYSMLAPWQKGEFLERHGLSGNDDASSSGNGLSLAVSPATGAFLRNMVLATQPQAVVELGSSFGVSTLYIARALRELGRGRVVAIEFDPAKVCQLRTNLAAAGLQDWVEVREGDGMQVLATLRHRIDFAFIDIWATGYLEAFRRLRPLLQRGAVVLADNMYTAAREVAAFRRHLRQDAGLRTTTLDFESGLEFTVVLQPAP